MPLTSTDILYSVSPRWIYSTVQVYNTEHLCGSSELYVWIQCVNNVLALWPLVFLIELWPLQKSSRVPAIRLIHIPSMTFIQAFLLEWSRFKDLTYVHIKWSLSFEMTKTMWFPTDLLGWPYQLWSLKQHHFQKSRFTRYQTWNIFTSNELWLH